MAKIIQKRKIEWVPEFRLDFRMVKDPEGGYSFDCDKDGKLLDPGRWAARVAELRADTNYVEWPVQEVQHKRIQPCIVQCTCGRKVHIWNVMGDRCECSRWYNSAGQELNPPSMWGEETGERFDDNGNYIGGGEY